MDGTSPAGGSGKIIGTVMGAFILAIVAPAINFLGISPNWADAVKGAIILISVVVSAARNIKGRRVIAGSARYGKEVENGEKKDI